MSLKHRFEITMNPERMRFLKNKLSFHLCIFALIVDILSLSSLFGYPPKINSDLVNGIDIIYHIVFLMLAFLAAEKTKRYSLGWSYGTAALGLLQGIKIFTFLGHYHNQGLMSSGAYALNIIYMLLSCFALIGAGVLCYVRATRLRQYEAQKDVEAKNG